MSDQLALCLDDTAFDRFHAENPKVYETLVRLAREWVARFGGHKLGIATLYETARWQITIATNDAEFRLNNNYRAWYARLIMAQEPDLAGLFDLRTSKADLWIAGAVA
jgi:hypothetical protein